jgi:hypothetical protein
VIVVDASAMPETLLRTPAAAAVEGRLFNSRQTRDRRLAAAPGHDAQN